MVAGGRRRDHPAGTGRRRRDRLPPDGGPGAAHEGAAGGRPRRGPRALRDAAVPRTVPAHGSLGPGALRPVAQANSPPCAAVHGLLRALGRPAARRGPAGRSRAAAPALAPHSAARPAGPDRRDRTGDLGTHAAPRLRYVGRTPRAAAATPGEDRPGRRGHRHPRGRRQRRRVVVNRHLPGEAEGRAEGDPHRGLAHPVADPHPHPDPVPVALQDRTPTRSATPTPTPSATPPDLEEQATALINQRRAQAGCGPLRIDPRLHTAAQRHSADMAARQYYEHQAPDGTGPDDRITATGYRWSSWGENLDRGPRTAAGAVNDWMGDRMHRDNLLNCAYTEVGIGVVQGAGGPWWTQDMAAPR
ncbi:CAP domain-containing protein [Streptomyces sp. RPA4-5]|uniref:CAP domain-containing protein n=1 Tax=Streptomyces sp. RPA4-5 TaxID=2721245 RepID=UPI0032B56BC1